MNPYLNKLPPLWNKCWPSFRYCMCCIVHIPLSKSLACSQWESLQEIRVNPTTVGNHITHSWNWYFQNLIRKINWVDLEGRAVSRLQLYTLRQTASACILPTRRNCSTMALVVDQVSRIVNVAGTAQNGSFLFWSYRLWWYVRSFNETIINYYSGYISRSLRTTFSPSGWLTREVLDWRFHCRTLQWHSLRGQNQATKHFAIDVSRLIKRRISFYSR